MARVAIDTRRLGGVRPSRRLLPKRGLGLTARVIGLASVAASLVAMLALLAPAEPTPAEPPAQAALTDTAGKGAARLSEAADRAADRRLRSVTAATATAWAALDGPEPVGSGPADLPPPAHFAGEASANAEWREDVFAGVVAADGRTLEAGAVRIRLAGIELPRRDEACRTLDGRLESCAARAKTQLELLTRHRKVHCHYRPGEGGDDAIGQCRIGASDLGERMLRTGLVRRTADAERFAASR